MNESQLLISGSWACECPLAATSWRGWVQAETPGSSCIATGRSILCSRNMWFCGGSPTHALQGQDRDGHFGAQHSL